MTIVLVVDDEPQIVRALRTSLTGHGYQVLSASNGEEALAAAAASQPKLLILDLGLPDMDGVEVIRRLREWSSVPVVVLSVRDAQTEKVAALDAGAGDYLTKPFGIEELLARVRATLRRAGPSEPERTVLRFPRLEVDLAAHRVSREGAYVHLTRTEYGLLEAFVTHPGMLLTHRWLLQRVWGPRYEDENHYLRVYVRQLRQKLGDEASAPTLIANEPGVGYRWLPTPDPDDPR